MILPIKLFLLDDHKIIRDGIKAMLLGHARYKVVGSFGNTTDFMSQFTLVRPDICILDIQLGGESGLDVAETIKRQHPEVKILILTALKETAPVKRCYSLGLEGMISKDSGSEAYLEALDALSLGKTFYAGQFTSQLLQASKLKTDLEEILTEREIEFLKTYAKGLSHKEIADALFISPRTVEVHKKNVMEKLKVTNTVDLIKIAIREGLASL
jgi:DNA-binding NarL/FixJ family response regulator